MRERWDATALAAVSLAAALLAGPTGPVRAEAVAADGGSPPSRPLRVVVTIKPIHSLAASILAGIADPVLLVDGQASPHSYALKPSAARAANEADVVVRVSPVVEPFTQRLLGTLPATVDVVTLAGLTDMHLLDVRIGDTFEPHDHASHHDSDTHHHDERPRPDAAVPPRHAADTARLDGHIWLDPGNARRIVAALAADFAHHAPAEAARIAANAAALDKRIAALDEELAAELAPARGRPFVVFHDAYQYMERRYGLEAAGAVTLSPDVQPSARRLSALRRRIAALGAVCVFSEPQFRDGVIAAVVEGTKARTGVIDPEGALLTPGPDLYFKLMRDLAAGMRDCLASLPER